MMEKKANKIPGEAGMIVFSLLRSISLQLVMYIRSLSLYDSDKLALKAFYQRRCTTLIKRGREEK